MQLGRAALAVSAAVFSMGLASSALAGDLTLNVGYHNPVDSTYGANLLWLGSSWGFEAGVGWVDVHDNTATNGKGEQTTKSTSFEAAGDLDLKYFFSGSGVRPYMQAGFGVGIGATAGSGSGAGAGTGGGFAGLGLLLGSKTFYAYVSLDMDSSKNGFAQGGLGVGI